VGWGFVRDSSGVKFWFQILVYPGLVGPGGGSSFFHSSLCKGLCLSLTYAGYSVVLVGDQLELDAYLSRTGFYG
jgi:hypothetical protein